MDGLGCGYPSRVRMRESDTQGHMCPIFDKSKEKKNTSTIVISHLVELNSLWKVPK